MRLVLEKPFFRLAIAALIIAGGIFAPIPFPFKVPLLALIALGVVWLETGGLTAVGLKKPESVAATLAWAIFGAAVIILGIGEVILPIIERAAGIEPDYSEYGALKGNLEAVLTLMAYAMISAAIAEEILFRGYLLHTFTALLGESFWAKSVSVILAALLFAIPHAGQGMVGLATVFLTGTFLGWLFFQANRNIFVVIIAHALVDIWGLTTLYLGN